MATIQKLTPDRDLQCYFFQPSAVAALSSTSTTGFTVSGTWRQQFDWAVIEWNRDNVFEHPAFRYLPDGDLSGVTLTYQETRTNCIPMDSTLFPTVDWPTLRIWSGAGASEVIYYVPLLNCATAVSGSYQCAYADFTLSGTLTSGDYIGLGFLAEAYTYQILGTDTLTSAALAVTGIINTFSSVCQATCTATTIRVYYTGGGPISTSTAGTNGNRFGLYSYASSTSGTPSETWDSPAKTFANGTSPTQWQVSLNFASLVDSDGTPIPSSAMTNVRKLRWTYAADLQSASYDRSEFQVVVSDWTVSGTNLTYSIAGPGSRRIEDDAIEIQYSGSWTESGGNYSGGTIHYTSTETDSLSCSYSANVAHTLYVGTRYTGNGTTISATVDGGTPQTLNLLIPGEDVLIRWDVGELGAGSHTITLAHGGPPGADFYFDFLELAVPATTLPAFPAQPRVTAATDWDTLHSQALAPERTAWLINSLGFQGRANHYVGALWFYELVATGQVYASATVTFSGTPQPDFFVTVTLNQVGAPDSDATVLQKLIHVGDTAQTIATIYALELNRGYTGVWASSSGNVLTIWAREMGTSGNSNTLTSSTTSSGFTAIASGGLFSGGYNGTSGPNINWRTDLVASPRINRAVRDWTLSYFTALKGYGLNVAASFSMEIGSGDPSTSVGIAQMGPAGDPILLPTPSLQTNFSPTSLAFWQEVYGEMAAIQASAGLQPYLQFGEVQWWYFPNNGAGLSYSGMPFYDAWNTANFLTLYGHPMATFTTNTIDPTAYPDESAYLPAVIGSFTNAVMSYVSGSQPTTQFEVLYPTDVNQTAFNKVFNFPVSAWTPAALTCLKTENFGFTLGRNLDEAEQTMTFGASLGFLATQRSQLVGVSDSTTAWQKEAQAALGKGFESVVLFALDQFCLIGYPVPWMITLRRSLFMGGA